MILHFYSLQLHNMKSLSIGIIFLFFIAICYSILPNSSKKNKKSNVAVTNNEVRNQKQYKYEVWLLGGFKDTITCEYKPSELEIYSLRGEYSLRRKQKKPLEIKKDIVVGCVRYKLINE